MEQSDIFGVSKRDTVEYVNFQKRLREIIEKLTLKKAIEILDWWINHKKQSMEHFLKEWNFENYDKATGVAKMLFESDTVAISNLETIRAELVPDCKHPKKMIDTLPDGQQYCMNCNMDL